MEPAPIDLSHSLQKIADEINIGAGATAQDQLGWDDKTKRFFLWGRSATLFAPNEQSWGATKLLFRQIQNVSQIYYGYEASVDICPSVADAKKRYSQVIDQLEAALQHPETLSYGELNVLSEKMESVLKVVDIFANTISIISKKESPIVAHAENELVTEVQRLHKLKEQLNTLCENKKLAAEDIPADDFFLSGTTQQEVEDLLQKFNISQENLPITKSEASQILEYVKRNKFKLLTGDRLGQKVKGRPDVLLVKKALSKLSHDFIFDRTNGNITLKLEKLGEGSYKVVKKHFTLNNLNQTAVAKQIIPDYSKKGQAVIAREIKISEMLRGKPYVVQVFENQTYSKIKKGPYGLSNDCQAHRMTMEFYNLGELKHYLGTFSYKQQLNIMREILLGIKEIHAAGILHRDLKPGNILLDTIKGAAIADFGLSCFKENDPSINDAPGTTIYLAPKYQRFSPYPDKLSFSEEGDYWALGIIFHQISKGSSPFRICYNLLGEIKTLNEEAFGSEIIIKREKPAEKNSIDYIIWKFLQVKTWKRMTPDEALQIIDNLLLAL